ncbi:MAG: TetR/AcrR family transcriptional regulator [Caldilineaceae bacterium]
MRRRKIISKQGVDALSIRGIADAIDYSPAGLYEYFGGKEEIIMAVVEQGFERFTRALESVDSTLPARDYAREVGLAYINFAVRNPDFFLLMFTTAPLSDFYHQGAPQPRDAASATAKLKNEPSFAVLYRAIERAAAEGLYHPRPEFGIFEMALTSWSHVHGIAMLRVTTFRDLPIDFTHLDRAALDVLFHGLSTR